MKKILLLTAIAAVLAIRAAAGVFIVAGTGVTIAANTTTNFTNMALPQVATLTLPAQNIYVTQGNITNTNLVFYSGLLTLDGTNFFRLAQSNQCPQTNALNGALFTWTNVSQPVYGALSVSNGQLQTITNFTGALQY